MNLGQEADKVLQGAAEPIDRPGHDDIEFPGAQRPYAAHRKPAACPALCAADPVILVDLDDLPAGTLGDLPQLALLIGRGLVDCRNPR